MCRTIPRSPSWHLQWAGTRRTSHAFRHEYGITVAEYSRSLRLEWALAQIALGDAPLARVAIDAGFSDQSHFTRAFRRHVGVTPGRYRKQTRR